MKHRPPGDDRRSAWYRPLEITAAEQRILTFADALVTWMKETSWPPDHADRIDGFMTHTTERNPGLTQFINEDPYRGVTKHWTLERLDPDANRLFMDLLRAAWERRCWQVRYGEREHLFHEDDAGS